MNEIDKMRNSQLADMEKPEIQASFIYAKKLVAQLRMMSTYDDGFRERKKKNKCVREKVT